MRRAFLALAAVAMWAGCGGEPVVTERHDVEALIGLYEDRFEVLDANGLARLYTEDAVLLPPGEGLVQGRGRIARFWRGRMGPGVRFEPLVARQGESEGYVAGTYVSPVETGKFMIGAVLEDDGVWRIVADIWNGDVPWTAEEAATDAP